MPREAATKLNAVIRCGEAMDLAARLRDQGPSLTAGLAIQFAQQVGIGAADLRLIVLPRLQDAGVVRYRYNGAELASIEEYVGLAAPILDQTVAVFEALSPTDVERAVVNSVLVASYAPLTKQDHLAAVAKMGPHPDRDAAQALTVGLTAGTLQRVRSADLGEDVVYNPSVWGSEAVGGIANFLTKLPSTERDALMGVVQDAASKPGIALSAMSTVDPKVLIAARRVGLIDSATVKSTAGGGVASQTYLFSPLIEADDARRHTTEALHERKLFTAHIMFGAEKAIQRGGRIRDPAVLVRALLNRGVVGPASNIGSDYHLVEAQGIVRVEQTDDGPLLRLVKREIVQDALGWIEQSYGVSGATVGTAPFLRSPTEFSRPERDRRTLPDEGAARELAESSILRLREEAARAANGTF